MFAMCRDKMSKIPFDDFFVLLDKDKDGEWEVLENSYAAA